MLNILVIYWVDKIPGGHIFSDNIMSWILLKLYIFSLPIQEKKKKRPFIHFQIQGAGNKTAGTQAIQQSIYLERNKTLFHSVLAGTALHQQTPI